MDFDETVNIPAQQWVDWQLKLTLHSILSRMVDEVCELGLISRDFNLSISIYSPATFATLNVEGTGQVQVELKEL